jgi:arylsulfatase
VKQPNVLWICSDQQRFDTLGVYGNRFVNTPNIDRLAAEGALFNNAFCQSPFCSPSRGSFLTGRYPRTCRQRQNGADIPDSELLVTKILQDRGYYNGLSGKLHLSAVCPTSGRKTEPRIDDGYDEFHWSHHSGSMGEAVNEYWDWLRKKGASYEIESCSASKYIGYGPPPEHSQTAWCCEKAIDFIRDRASDGKPWLFSVNMFDPHHGFDAPFECVEKYLDILDQIPLPAYVEGELDDKTVWQQIDHRGAYGGRGMAYTDMSDEDHRLVRASYWAMCELIDEQVGRTLSALEETGQRDNTLVIYTSDHGEMLGDHGIYLKGPYFYDCAIHVPLIMNMPGVIEPQVVDDLVECVDIPETILDLAGSSLHPGMQGKSLMPILSGKTHDAQHRDDVYCEAYNACDGHNSSTGERSSTTMVRTEKYKLAVAHNQDTGELYDLERDPGEHTNLWDDASYAGIKTDMLVRLCNRMAYTVDPLPERIAPW